MEIYSLHSSGGQKLGLARLVPSRGSEEDYPLSVLQHLMATSHPWCSLAGRRIAPASILHLHMAFSSAGVSYLS